MIEQIRNEKKCSQGKVEERRRNRTEKVRLVQPAANQPALPFLRREGVSRAGGVQAAGIAPNILLLSPPSLPSLPSSLPSFFPSIFPSCILDSSVLIPSIRCFSCTLFDCAWNIAQPRSDPGCRPFNNSLNSFDLD